MCCETNACQPCTCELCIVPCPPKCKPPKPVCNKILIFKSDPVNNSWTENTETVLYDETVKTNCFKCASVDFMASVEIVPSANRTWHTFRLYIDNKVVCVCGMEGEGEETIPNLDNVSLMWAGKLGKQTSMRVRVTVVARELNPSPVTRSANVDNSTGRFQGAKGAFLRIEVD